MEMNLVPLTTAGNQYQISLISEVLQGAGIPFTMRDSAALSALGVGTTPLTSKQILVPQDRLQEAKDVLCAGGIVCEVSERLLTRALEEIVDPLLEAGDPDLDRLRRFIQVNNKDTSRALMEATLEKPGGPELLENLFFKLDQSDDVACLRALARALGSKVSGDFFERLKESLSAGTVEKRIALLETIPDLPNRPDRADALAVALRSTSSKIRDAAGEALFALGLGDFGYEAEGPPDEREEAITKFLGFFK